MEIIYILCHTGLPEGHLIAATAGYYGLELKTLNIKHYPMIEGLSSAYLKEGK